MAKETAKKEVPKAVDAFGDFEMVNQGKYDRAVAIVGNTDDKRALLAAYDSLGGFIRYQNSKVFTGAFWDFKNKRPHEDPQPRILRRQAAVVEETIEVADVEVVDAPKKGRGKKVEETEETE